MFKGHLRAYVTEYNQPSRPMAFAHSVYIRIQLSCLNWQNTIYGVHRENNDQTKFVLFVNTPVARKFVTTLASVASCRKTLSLVTRLAGAPSHQISHLTLATVTANLNVSIQSRSLSAGATRTQRDQLSTIRSLSNTQTLFYVSMSNTWPITHIVKGQRLQSRSAALPIIFSLPIL